MPSLSETLLPAEPADTLEVDAVWSFVLKRSNKRWLWTALCRRTRQIVAFVIGDRSEATCQNLWHQIPAAYKGCQSYSDSLYANFYFWHTYDRQEIDLVEEREGNLSGYEFKWSPIQKLTPPKHWKEAYPKAEYRVITPENYLEFIVP